MRLGPGAQVNRFVVEAPLHSGGMGELYRASAPGEPGPLVLKLPRLGHGEPAEAVTSFEVESTVLSALRGPHVPRLAGAGDLSAQPFLAMELVEGEPLSAWTERAPLPAGEVARLGAAVATALQAVHLQEVVHLDLKPSNVILRPDGQAVLIDFGLSRHAHFPDLLAEELRHPVGSAPYISPEQVQGLRGDPRSDLFALGAILYQLATGALPFGAPGSARGLRKRLYRDPVPPRRLAPDLPPWLQEVILRALEPHAGARHLSAAQLAFELLHPESVELTERATRRKRRAGLRELLRWLRATGFDPPPATPSELAARGAIVGVAVAPGEDDAPLLQALREAGRQLLEADPAARLACLTVVKPRSPLGGDTPEDTATAQRIQTLMSLRHFAEPLRLPPQRLSLHALEARDPARALVAYARANGLSHLVVGASSTARALRALLGSVAHQVAAEAPCSVTVVRPRAAGATRSPGGASPA